MMNATTDPFGVDMLSAVEWESLMLTTAKSVLSKRKTGMVVRKLLIWGVPKRTCSMSARNTVLRKDDDCCCWVMFLQPMPFFSPNVTLLGHIYNRFYNSGTWNHVLSVENMLGD